MLGTTQIWLQSPERTVSLAAASGRGPGVVVELSADAADSVVLYDSRIALLVTRNGTSSFDTVTSPTATADQDTSDRSWRWLDDRAYVFQ